MGLLKFSSLACRSLIMASCSTADIGLFFLGFEVVFVLVFCSGTGRGGGGGGTYLVSRGGAFFET